MENHNHNHSTQNSSLPKINLETYGKQTSVQEQEFIKGELKKIFSKTGEVLQRDKHIIIDNGGFDEELITKAIKSFKHFCPSHPTQSNGSNNFRSQTDQFPGAQPVSFQQSNIYQIQQHKFIVCEKSDGLRYFLIETNKKEFYIVDRQFNIRKVSPRYIDFSQTAPSAIVNIFDGELVLDNHQRDIPIFLVFDAMLVNGRSCMLESFTNRLLAGHNEIRRRVRSAQVQFMKNQGRNQNGRNLPKNIVDIYMKDMFRLQDVEYIFNNIVPKLQHENDGLIMTQDLCPYYPGTCQEILKWKPRHLNTIDFRLKLLSAHTHQSYLWGLQTCSYDRITKTKQLHLFDFIFFDYEVKDQNGQTENDRMRTLIQNSPDMVCIIECYLDDQYAHPHLIIFNKLKYELENSSVLSEENNLEQLSQGFDFNMRLSYEDREQFKGGWRFHRHRSERVDPNAQKSATSVLDSIKNGIEMQDLIHVCSSIPNLDNGHGNGRRRLRSSDGNDEEQDNQIKSSNKKQKQDEEDEY
eukprot:403330727